MWRALRKRRALRSYRRQLPVHLRRTYGTQQHYALEQVQYTVQRWGMSAEFLCYALAMYCDRATFDAFHASTGELCDYDLMRTEAGDPHSVASGRSTQYGDGPEHHAVENVFIRSYIACEAVRGGSWFDGWSDGGTNDSGGSYDGGGGGFDGGGGGDGGGD